MNNEKRITKEMETREITVAVSAKEITTKQVTVRCPDKPEYWSRVDDGVFFAEGLILFAIVPKYPGTFYVVEVKRGKQDFDDFVPTKDCRRESWLKRGTVRHTALQLLSGEKASPFVATDWKQISSEEFHQKRTELLDFFKEFEP